MSWLPDGKLPDEISAHPGWKRLEDQRTWYADKSAYYQRSYRRIKISQIILASAIPLLSFIELQWGRWLAAGAGAVIAVLEGVQQLNQYSRLWVEYRSMADRLKRDKYLFLAGTGPYQGLDMDARLASLAMRVEDLVSTEHERWVSNATQSTTDQPGSRPVPAGAAAPTHPEPPRGSVPG